MSTRRTFLKLMTAAASALALPITALLPKRRGPKVTISDEPVREGIWAQRRYETIGIDPYGAGCTIALWYKIGADGEPQLVDRKILPLG